MPTSKNSLRGVRREFSPIDNHLHYYDDYWHIYYKFGWFYYWLFGIFYGFHEIKETIDQKKKGKLLKLNPIDAKNAKFPSTDADKFAKLINKIDEYIDCQNKTNEIQHETNEIQRETNKRILLYLENQDKLNIEMYNHLQNK